MLNYISASYRTSFGIIFVELLDDFEATSSQVAWIQSIGEPFLLGMGETRLMLSAIRCRL